MGVDFSKVRVSPISSGLRCLACDALGLFDCYEKEICVWFVEGGLMLRAFDYTSLYSSRDEVLHGIFDKYLR